MNECDHRRYTKAELVKTVSNWQKNNPMLQAWGVLCG